MGKEGSWKDKKYQVPVDPTSVVEAASICLAVLAIVRAIQFNNYGIVIILGTYVVAFAFVFATTLWQSGRENVPLVAAMPSQAG